MNQLATVPVAKGMLVRQSKSDVGVIKTQRVELMKKKAFVDRFKSENPNATTKDAQRAFDDYRIQTLKEFNAQLGQAFASGNIQAERITADGNGEMRTIALVRRNRTEQDKEREALTVTARVLGLTLDELLAQKKKNVSADIILPPTPAGATVVVDQAPAA